MKNYSHLTLHEISAALERLTISSSSTEMLNGLFFSIELTTSKALPERRLGLMENGPILVVNIAEDGLVILNSKI